MAVVVEVSTTQVVAGDSSPAVTTTDGHEDCSCGGYRRATKNQRIFSRRTSQNEAVVAAAADKSSDSLPDCLRSSKIP